VTHAQTWTSYSAVYRFRSLSQQYLVVGLADLRLPLTVTVVVSRVSIMVSVRVNVK